MNYKVLYRKYRPDSFTSLIGQEHVVTILKNSIKENRIAHAYLFSGPRGTGKTSTARILSKSINCLNNKKGVACGDCEVCNNFSTNPDIIEIDAASNNGVDEIRELINNVKIMPTSLKYKVYIIDEVHMLSQSAFNALLLTLEEPPEHVIFILATTNIESVPITILSRCQRFDFKRINEVDILNRLKYVCDEENIKFEDDALNEIAVLSDGGLRDALSILDQLSKNDEVITTDLVSKEIGSISNQKITDLIKCLDNEDIEGIENIFNEFQNTNLNYKVAIKKIIYKLSDIGADILKGNTSWKLDFDVCKNLVMELNNLMNKISINVEPYLLIKMTFLSVISPRKSVSKNKEENQVEKTSVDNSKVLKNDVEIFKEKPRKNEDTKFRENLVNVRINNCFCKASKNYLTDLKEKWEEFIMNVDNSYKGLISDTLVVTASDTHAIMVSTLPHKDVEINKALDNLEKLFNDYFNTNYKFIFISENKWNEEKKQYIENLQKKYVYTFMEEEKLNIEQTEDDEFMSVSSIFGDMKIEVE